MLLYNYGKTLDKEHNVICVRNINCGVFFSTFD